MMRFIKALACTAAILALGVAPGIAQMAPPAAPPSGSAAPAVPRAPGSESMPPQEKQIEGPVKKIDPAAKTVQVGWFLGLFRTTLEVNDDTQILGEGLQKGSLADIREGETVKASYESRDGKNVAKFIEVKPAQAKEAAPAPSRSPASPGAPPIGASSGPGAPPAGRPVGQ